ncbi:MAG: AI-2E family transporter [Anaerotignum sp.]|nr:AI-2E family transporter [Anaerotignum sp.]
MRKFDLFRRNKNEHDKLLGKISLYVIAVAVLLILFEKVVGNLPAIGTSITAFFDAFNNLVSPFIMGFAIAYVMNPFMMFFEKRFLKWFGFCRKHKKLTRTFSILLIYTIIIGGTVWIVIYLVPEIRDSIMAFATNISGYSEAMNERIRYIFDQIPFIDSADVNNVINRILAPIQHMSQNAPELLETLAANVFIFGRLTLNFIMAIFIAFYMLYDKERFAKKMEKGAYAFSTEEKACRFLANAERIHHIFNDFIVGKAIDSLIIGILALIGLNIIKAPFPLILALIIGVTNMIPYFGPFIGAIPAILITLLIDPPLAIVVGIFILILQQFDGNFLGPKILGESVDLSPLWIILAVLIGGALMGPLGMFIGVPIFATVKVFGGEYIDSLYWKKYPSSNPLNLSKTKNDTEEE